MSETATVSEIFASIQGEGKFAGCMHLFVRFAGCNLNCAYCDTPKRTSRMAVEFPPASTVREFFPHPVDKKTILEQLQLFLNQKYRYQALSLTGGEPLLQPSSVLLSLSDWAHGNGIPVLLETNGTLPDALSKVVSKVDVVSMDVKVRSATAEEPRDEENAEFLKIAYRSSDVYVKVVVSDKTTREEMERVARMVAEVDECIELFIQPLTPRRGQRFPDASLLLALYQVAAKHLLSVRIIPQCHKFLRLK